MADSVDRVFVHALNTVKRVPKTGATRPPASDRLRLYGLYKQAMEGDVDGVMERPTAATVGTGVNSDELQREKDKWDAWNAQRGISRTEAKRRYIEALIETMHRFATTPDARELVSELEFVWSQIKNNSSSTSDSSPQMNRSIEPQTFAQPATGTEGPMKVISPMSEDDAAAQEYREQQGDEEGDGDGDDEYIKKGDKWSRKVEKALVRLSAEVAALREQITAGREWRTKKEKSFRAWISWLGWLILKHFIADSVVLCVVLLWMRRRKDRRLEDLVRSALKLAREYARKLLPSR
ncbi:Acyl CoA binding family protein [Apiospora arundinis]|uniref:Acyl CoA binding family protein n=1 Tax=Apiospora arundinis TaxID=335852 RepID=A0ABR2IEQ7_9PEZI